MFVVKRCVRDYGDIWKTEVAHFDTEAEAVDFADQIEPYGQHFGEWYEVDEE